MRIIALADTHGFHHDLVLPEGDVLIHAGDLSRAGELAQVEETLRWLRRWPHPVKIVVAGNHDRAFERPHERARALALCAPDLTYLEDAGVTVDGVRFWGSPWQPDYHDWAFNLPRGEALASKWQLIPEDVDVLITHGPPAGAGDRPAGAGRQGCRDLRARVAQLRPRLHLFGHIHEDGGVWIEDGVVCVNVTAANGERGPTVIELEANLRRVQVVAAPAAAR